MVTQEAGKRFIVITSSKVHNNVLELWVRLFLNGHEGRIRLRLRPPGVSFEGIIGPLKISRNRHAFNPSSNEQLLPRTQLNLPIISERILNYLVFETSDSSSVFRFILGPFCIIEHQEIDISVISLKVLLISSLNFTTIIVLFFDGHYLVLSTSKFPKEKKKNVSKIFRIDSQKILTI